MLRHVLLPPVQATSGLSPCCVADREAKAFRVLLHQLADQGALAHTRWPTDHNGGANARQINLQTTRQQVKCQCRMTQLLLALGGCGAASADVDSSSSPNAW